MTGLTAEQLFQRHTEDVWRGRFADLFDLPVADPKHTTEAVRDALGLREETGA